MYKRQEQALGLAFEQVQPGFTWGNTYEYCWFRSRIELPGRAEGKRIVMNLKPGGESTLFVNGRSFGTYRADWVSEPHHYMEDNTLTRSGKAGASYEAVSYTHLNPQIPGK